MGLNCNKSYNKAIASLLVFYVLTRFCYKKLGHFLHKLHYISISYNEVLHNQFLANSLTKANKTLWKPAIMLSLQKPCKEPPYNELVLSTNSLSKTQQNLEHMIPTALYQKPCYNRARYKEFLSQSMNKKNTILYSICIFTM